MLLHTFANSVTDVVSLTYFPRTPAFHAVDPTQVKADIQQVIEFAQRNGEGELIEYIHGLRGRVDGAVVNAGAYSHSSLAIRDALTGVAMPFVEVHITNVYGREPERRHSMLAPAAIGVVCGLGTYGYELALRGLVAKLSARSATGSVARV